MKHCARQLPHRRVVPTEADKLRSGAPPSEAVFAAATAGRVAAVIDALRFGFDVDTEDARGNTLLLIAVRSCHKRIVDAVVARGCNVNHQDQEGSCMSHAPRSSTLAGEVQLCRVCENTPSKPLAQATRRFTIAVVPPPSV